jgi:hypothetical protein
VDLNGRVSRPVYNLGDECTRGSQRLGAGVADLAILAALLFVLCGNVLSFLIAPDLVALSQRCERIRYRHLARFVAF